MGDTPQLDRSDRIGMYLSIGMACTGAVVAITSAVERLREVAADGPVPVTVPLNGESAALPLGPDGSPVDAVVETATVEVGDPAAATLFALYAQPVWQALVVIAGLAAAVLFFARLASGRAFTRGAARLAYVAAAIVGVGWLGSSILTNMTTNGAMAAISDHTYGSTTFEISLVPVLAILLIGAVGAALQIGERLQRDTEGLV
ncbi:hypothetical protein [Demequina sp. NBRC 110053]|uniref:hypothetical protein n=1 Tax=Demequina sp. NBRC 110053 TaxID=1570342 RepID=UPI0011861CDB|nr:hypothetical protein [Demequina sp. NBRC 110053]